jgi:hypothetical protein
MPERINNLFPHGQYLFLFAIGDYLRVLCCELELLALNVLGEGSFSKEVDGDCA